MVVPGGGGFIREDMEWTVDKILKVSLGPVVTSCPQSSWLFSHVMPRKHREEGKVVLASVLGIVVLERA